MTPKPLTVWAVVDCNGNVWSFTARWRRKDSIKALEDEIYGDTWETLRKRGFTVRKFRMVPVEAPGEGEG